MRAHLRPLAMAVAILAAGTFGAAPVAAAGPAPGEACVAGTVWTDLESGVKWLCIYDELYGGSRWELLSTFLQVWSQGWLSRSMATGCTLGTVAMTALGGSGADAFVRSYRWPCATTRDRVTQPPGDLRVRTTIQHYNGSWITCRDTGYAYNTVSSFGWRVGVSMGTAPDCGTGYYRSWGYASVFEGGAWRGGTIFSPILQIR